MSSRPHSLSELVNRQFLRQAFQALVVGFVLLCSLLVSTRLQASSRDLKWKTVETEHFYIHYYAGEEEAAERMAMTLERAHHTLSHAFSHQPFLKVHVIVRDDTDSANGSATTLPFPRISANVTAPDSMSVLESYDDWIDILMTHEYVHIVHLDTIHGLPRVINAIFGFGVLGQLWSPNIVQPRWIVEGLATYEESRLGSQGRHRSAQFDMMLRMAVLEQGFLSIDQVTNGANIFPYGSSVYLYGLHLMHYIGSRYGHDKLRNLAHIYGGQAIPLGIHRSIKKVLGVDFEQLWREFQQDLARRFQAQARRVRGRGIREGRRLTYSTSSSPSGSFTRHPFWSKDDQWIYFYEDDGHSNPGFRRIRARGGRIREGLGVGRQGMNMDIERVFEVQTPSVGDFVGASEDLVFTMVRTHDFRYNWNDLYRWHPPNPNHVERLTYGLRASEPKVSPDGRTVVFSRNDVAQSRLAFLELATGDVVEVKPIERLQQVLSPTWSPDGQRVTYSGWREGGYRDIYVYERSSGQTSRITADRFLDIEPNWTPDGKYILFSSDRDEIFNIYAYEVASSKVWQVSNVLGGAFEPVVSHDGTRIVYIGFSNTGYDLWVMEFNPEDFLQPSPPISALPLKSDPTPSLPQAQGRPLTLANKRYMPIKTFYPRVILPAALEFQGSGFGSELALTTEIADVLGFHSLIGNFTYLFPYKEPTGSVSYSYRQLLPSFTIEFGRGFFLRNGFERYDYEQKAVNGEATGYQLGGYRERITRVSGSVSVPVVRHPIHSADASLQYQFTRYTNADADLEVIDPNAPVSIPPQVGDVGQINMSLSYNNLRSVRFSYLNETGRSAAIRFSLINPAFGGQFRDLQVTGTYSEMIRMPWRGHQVLALRLTGGASAGGFSRRGAFFVGGYSQEQDIVRTLIARSALGEAGVLRGFQPGAFAGQFFTVLNTEYRIPLADVERGIGALPLFMRRILLIPFTDVGGAWTDNFRREILKVGVGGSLVFVFSSYGEAINLFLTYAHGFDQEKGLNAFRAVIARSF